MRSNLDETIRAVFGTFALWYNSLTMQFASRKNDGFVSDWQAAYADKHHETIYRNHIPDYVPVYNIRSDR